MLDVAATSVIQKAIRGKLVRKKYAILIEEDYQPVFDRSFFQFFYYNKRTGKSSWTRPKRTLLYQDAASAAAIRIQSAARNKLIALLKSKIKKRSHPSRSPSCSRQDKKRDKTCSTKRPIYSWSTGDVLMFFASIGLSELHGLVQKHKVDGLLLLCLDKDDWYEMGISDEGQAQCIKNGVRKFVHRDRTIGRPRSRGDQEQSIENETIGANNDSTFEPVGDENKPDITNEEPSSPGGHDSTAVTLQILYEGLHGASVPKNGDVVQMHYKCGISGSELVLENSKDRLNGKPFEFVLGLGHVIEGIEIALRQMRTGTRALVGIRKDKGYIEKELSLEEFQGRDLWCELELVSFRKRNSWFKPYIQKVGYSQKPYHTNDEEPC